ncbi:hypothetical protein WN943_027265 [Citrus x changshan-huyou]
MQHKGGKECRKLQDQADQSSKQSELRVQLCLLILFLSLRSAKNLISDRREIIYWNFCVVSHLQFPICHGLSVRRSFARRMNCFILDIIAGASLEICEQQKKGNMESVQHISFCTHITAGKDKIE